ncbi:MAG: secretin N-terminal domain-containing protein [Burkholderiales bacterium]
MMARLLRRVAGPLLVLLAAGCATQALLHEGRELARQGDTESALARIDAALRLEPNNAELRLESTRMRENAVNALIARAAAAARAGDSTQAAAAYRRVLAIEPGNPRATAGLEDLKRLARHAEWMREAESAAARGDALAAARALRPLLAEAPDDARAQALKRRLEERPAQTPAQAALSTALRKPVTVEFRDTPLRQVFDALTRASGVNFVFDRDVRADQRTTVFLRNTTVESAVNLVLMTNQLEQRALDGASVLIYPNTPAKAREYQPLVVRTFFLSNADARAVANTVRSIVKTRDMVVDEKQNMIIMRDTPEAVRLAERLVGLHDLAEPEVMLEVEVLEVSRTRLMELGIRWPDSVALTPLPGVAGGTLTLNDLRNLSGASVGATVGATTINARAQVGDVNLLANPRIRSKNREKARVVVGERVPNITTTTTATGFVAESVQYIEVGLKLDVEPTIHPDNEVAIRISMEVSNIVSQVQTRQGTTAFQIGTRNATTVLRLKDGENQVLAGLISDEDRSTGNRIPGLGDLPILGRLFGSQRDARSRSEIVLSITPRLIRDARRPGLAQTEFDAGTEASLRSRPIETGVEARGMTLTLSGPTLAPAPAAGVAAVAAQPSASPPGAAALSLQGQANARVGSTFSVFLAASNLVDVTSVPFALGFDTRSMEVVEVSEGDLLRQGGAATTFNHRVDRGAGQIFGTVARTGAGSARGSGTLVRVTFRAIAPGPAGVRLLTVAPVGEGGRSPAVAPPAPFAIQIGP